MKVQNSKQIFHFVLLWKIGNLLSAPSSEYTLFFYKKHLYKKHEAQITGPVDCSGNIEENKKLNL